MVESNRKLLSAHHLSKVYYGRAENVVVLDNLEIEVSEGEMVAIVGASGAGKSTLLHLLGGLDRPSSGSLKIGEFDIAKSPELDLARFRNERIGFIFQYHHLLPEFSALENVMMPLLIGGGRKREVSARAQDLLARVGLSHRAEHQPGELSGGEQQRVALARALISSPSLLLADEPTGNLDQKTGEEVYLLIRRMQVEEQLSAIIVTHNERLAATCDRVMRLENGRVHQL